ncbi:MmcQ/YjbR family DNA-binding protein [Pseudonocardia zijingensis]|jgi:hypothetical protein|uniref:MmcQ/YjbR family DNA-binding protein n=1 Tax=Pseudonocardia zijingensis TaxID=153376 RepID=A0ABP3ZMP0_9PSEU
MVTVDEVRRLARSLPRTTEHLIHDRVKFRVGQIVYVAFSRDETVMGFAYPKEERDALIASDPATFHLPGVSDLRFNWVHAWTAALEPDEMRELVVDAWRMVVPKRVAAAHLEGGGPGPQPAASS